MIQDHARERLLELLGEHYATPLPKLPTSMAECEAFLAFYEAGGYISGLADQFVNRGRIDVDRILLSGSADLAVNDASDASDEELAALRRYWHVLVEMAHVLGDVSGVPISWVHPSLDFDLSLPKEFADLSDLWTLGRRDGESLAIEAMTPGYLLQVWSRLSPRLDSMRLPWIGTTQAPHRIYPMSSIGCSRSWSTPGRRSNERSGIAEFRRLGSLNRVNRRPERAH